ncbi:MAG: alpha/beta hydrolase family protein [Blastocatellia bacterium]
MTFRPQEPAEPLCYGEEDVLLESEEGRVQLAGTFTRPRTSTKTAAVLLIPGSGSHDRDEQLCGHRPFLVLSDHLTRAGIAVLRLDDRGVGGSTGDKDRCTHDDLLRDVHVALDFLAGHRAVDATRLGLIGHSEGAMLAAAAAIRLEQVALIVLMGCPALPGEQTIHEQSALISRLSGATDAQVAHERRMNEEVFAVLKHPLRPESERNQILSILATYLKSWPDQPAEDDGVETHVNEMADNVLTPAFRSFLNCDPAFYFRRVRCPVLALFGEVDIQVPPAMHMQALREALSVAGNPDVTVEECRGLNHLFQTAITGSISEYEVIEETIAPSVLERISGWISSRADGSAAEQTDAPERAN